MIRHMSCRIQSVYVTCLTYMRCIVQISQMMLNLLSWSHRLALSHHPALVTVFFNQILPDSIVRLSDTVCVGCGDIWVRALFSTMATMKAPVDAIGRILFSLLHPRRLDYGKCQAPEWLKSRQRKTQGPDTERLILWAT